jgi:hypothetical protein
VEKHIVAYVLAGSEDLYHEEFDSKEKAMAFITGEGHTGLDDPDYRLDEDKALLISVTIPQGSFASGEGLQVKVEDHT